VSPFGDRCHPGGLDEEQATILQILSVLVAGLLGEGQEEVEPGGLRVLDLPVADDDLALRRPSPRLRPVGLRLGDVLPVCDRRLGQDDPRQDNPLAPFAADPDLVAHAVPGAERPVPYPAFPCARAMIPS